MNSETMASVWIQDSGSRDGNKRRLTVDQVGLLERSFNAENKLEHERKVQIAEESGLKPRQVAVWFQNRRARSKSKKIKYDFDCLNAEYVKLNDEFDTLLKLNQQLKAEVDELRETWITREKMKNAFGAVELEAIDSSVTELGKLKANAMSELNVYMREDEGSPINSSSREEHELLGYFNDELSADDLFDSFDIIISNEDEHQSFS